MTGRDHRCGARQLRRMKLRDLDILSSVVLRGSMAKAASDLGVSQPAISEAIARLEAAAGARLLDRSTRGIAPTVFGLALVKRATVAFDELEQGSERLNPWPTPAPAMCV